MTHLYGGIEAGGTKFVCAIANEDGQLLTEVRFPTTTPQETLQRCIDFFREENQLRSQPVRAIGIACFGPIDLKPSSPTYGFITSTPKEGWQYTSVLKPLQEALQVPIAFDHDVVVAAIGEGTWGAAKGLENYVYLTIGTGIGGGVIAGGKPVHGLVHPEIGHLIMRRDPKLDPFPGACPFHQDCLEGLASGPAIEKRYGTKGQNLPPDHPAWELEAKYLADGLHDLICTISPDMLILGGGVMEQTQLFPMIRRNVLQSLNGYIQAPLLLEHADQYIVPPALGNKSGALGCIAMARQLVD